jgi:hypothetical protein
MITERKLRVYSLLSDIIFKAILTLVVIGIFIALTIAFLRNPNSAPLAASDTIFGIAILIVIRYYFPTRKH